MISKTNCTLLANEKTMFNENIYEPTEFAVCYEPRAIRALRCATKLGTLRYEDGTSYDGYRK